MATLTDALRTALAHHQAGRLELAAEIYRRVLAVEPNHPDALHLLGMVHHQRGESTTAIDLISRAVALSPTAADYHRNLGDAHRAAGQMEQAVACYQRALELAPHDVAAHNKLGIAYRAQGKLAEATTCYRRALELAPALAEVLNNLGNALADQQQTAEACDCYRQALQRAPNDPRYRHNLGTALEAEGRRAEAIGYYRYAIKMRPDFAEAYASLGNALQAQGELAEAVTCLERAVALKPDFAEAHNNLGNVLRRQGRLGESIAACRRALELKPDLASAHNNLGSVLKDLGRLDEAVDCYRKAIELRPDFTEAHNNLGNAWKDQGQIDEALACYRRAVEAKPDFVHTQCNLLYTLHFSPTCDAATLYAELRRFNEQYARPLAATIQPHANDRAPDRRLRVGYVSPDFRKHPVGRFLLPLLEAHDRQQYDIWCYASVEVRDAITERCQAAASVWRDVTALDDEELAAAIRADGIDILVDLTMHMAHSRLGVFARKPAPVQVTYLAYCGTTGLDAMDYRLTDPYLDPPGGEERFYVEQSVRLPETYWCYHPMTEAPAPGELPARTAGYVTFGSLNNFCKFNPATLAAWCQLLAAVPDSRLLLHAAQGGHRERTRALFAGQGVSAERLKFVDFLPAAQYFRIYQQIDVALDPFPYGGGTTTCDALWMGVPVVSLAGQTAVGRGGLSILSNVGLPELVAHTPDEYLQIATHLAADRPRLAELRATLRERMQRSPLMDAPRFARNVEAAYRTMWRRWCAGEEAG
jgi:predicted O-linked N-acetylglucosamine transferase (SPINDLY family)